MSETLVDPVVDDNDPLKSQLIDVNKLKTQLIKLEEELVQLCNKAQKTKSLCEEELDMALPQLHAAYKALQSISPNDIDMSNRVNSMNQRPPAPVRSVMSAVLILLKVEPQPMKKTASSKNGEKQDFWLPARKMLCDDPRGFLKQLMEFDKDNIEEETISKLRELMNNEESERTQAFNKDAIAKVSSVCSKFGQWVLAMEAYYEVSKVVAPLRETLAAEEKEVVEKMSELQLLQEQLKETVDAALLESKKRDQ
eukprot:gene19623-23467_t